MRRPNFPVAAGIAVIIAAVAFLVYQGISSNLVYYITPTELASRGAAGSAGTVRLGGQVRPGSVTFNPSGHLLRFVVQDPKTRVHVISHSLPPQMFRGGIGVVVEGRMSGREFLAGDVLIKHSNQYRAPKPGQTPLPDNYIPRGSS